MSGKELIKRICTSGTPAEKKELFQFDADTPLEKVVTKFGLFARSCYPRYFQHPSAPFHKVMVTNYLRSYLLDENRMELGFRGCAKTSLLELAVTFVLLNDKAVRKKYIKILARDLKNSKQLVTDIYNKVIEVEHIYGDLFEDEGKKKREETMSSFTMKKGVKLSAGTVGQAQRGHKQDAFRPDWVLYEDIEDSESISSQVITAGVMKRCDESINGLAMVGASFVVNGNYISEDGTIEWFKKKSNVITNITPIMTPDGEPTWSVITKERIEQLRKDSLDFAGEYLCDPQRSGAKYFDQDRIKHDLLHVKLPTHNSGSIKYWSSYNPSNAYGIGADTSEGKGMDSNAMVLWDFTTSTVVGTFYDNEIQPDLFAFELVRVGREFGNCILAPEVNNTSGGMVIQVLKEKDYPNIHRKTLTDRMNNVLTKQLGWHTNSKTKPQMLAEFRRDYNNGLIHIYDEALLKEMRAFNINDVSEVTTGLVTRHFDLLMSCFVENTMILTNKGQVPIQDLRVGDKVLTRKGYKRIISTRSQYKPVIKRLGLIGTADHPVIVNDTQIKDLQRVSHGDILTIWNEQTQSIENRLLITESNTGVTPTLPIATIEFTSWEEQPIKNQEHTFIDKYGLTTTVQFLKGIVYTIKTTIRSIISLKILSYLATLNICVSTWKNQKEKKHSEKFSDKTERRLIVVSENQLKPDQNKQKYVNGVASLLRPLVTMLVSAQGYVLNAFRVSKRKNRQLKEFAQFVAPNSSHVYHIEKDVQTYAIPKDAERVFNIEVEDQPEYFANNILVHNCAIGWQMRNFAYPEETEEDEVWGDYSLAQV